MHFDLLSLSLAGRDDWPTGAQESEAGDKLTPCSLSETISCDMRYIEATDSWRIFQRVFQWNVNIWSVYSGQHGGRSPRATMIDICNV